MKIVVDLCIVPIGVGTSLSAYVAECQKILHHAGLKTQMHAYGTNIEGEWDKVMGAVKACHERIHEMGTPRISTILKVGSRTDREQTMEDRVSSVEDKLSD